MSVQRPENSGPTSQPGPIANRVLYLAASVPTTAYQTYGNVVNVVPATDNAAPLCCRFAALRQVGGTRSDVAFPTCFSPLRTPCVVLSLEFTCGRWLELWRSLPGNHIETNGNTRIRRRHEDGDPDWTTAADGYDASGLRFSIAHGICSSFLRCITIY